ncbi:MAG: hypothetical protein HFJ07_05185 [Lachnospiraceae bacterium]|jgi:hypothetical protein|nr:hypothetical protein [Lachnospiraceae bacterium]
MGWLIGGKKYQRLQAEVSQPCLFYLEFIEKYTDYMEKNYYIEAQTRSLGRTDVVVDYQGEQFIIEMKIWHGNEYYQRGKQQLAEYLKDYHQKKGYMVSFCFNKKKQIGVREIVAGDKILVEAIV